jgi:hypothetical protein
MRPTTFEAEVFSSAARCRVYFATSSVTVMVNFVHTNSAYRKPE